ncbi:hypothetical protein C2845_PM07G34430 [Panicum miliaceum]|uniref:Uncharacterized protein n=1 Tax=Panicum miliaceum TaxID=4540 RepID=A0A3L6SQZ7_PANMI|nr:hypothetical protein C2845_PM07G34430 [Panicum miliaceum]
MAYVWRSAAVREAERDVSIHALVAVQMDAAARLTCDVVRREVFGQLRISELQIQVSLLRPATFLLRFDVPVQRNAVLSRDVLAIGHSRLHLMPWTRHFGASASKLFYHVRVCIEGVPPHAEQIEAVSQLFDRRTFIECIDFEKEMEDERACFCVWVRMGDLDTIPRDGMLQVEEPLGYAHEAVDGFADLGGQHGPALLLSYRVILHIDRVADYNSPPSSSHRKL